MTAPPALQLESVRLGRFGPFTLHADFGERLAIYDPGETVPLFWDFLAGLRQPSRGSQTEAGGQMHYIDADGTLYPRLSLAENFSFYAGLRGFAKAEVARVFTLLGLQDHAQKHPQALLPAQRHLAAVGIGLLGDPDILIANALFAKLGIMQMQALADTLQPVLSGKLLCFRATRAYELHFAQRFYLLFPHALIGPWPVTAVRDFAEKPADAPSVEQLLSLLRKREN
ncbi:MAG: hypothetical protein IMW91_09155 [Firmicutes bacterium]|nr:hypothetical protein [Bacillota bacterium]